MIGSLLCIKSGHLKAISQENASAGQRLKQVFDRWENSALSRSPYTWATIIDVLNTEVVGEKRLASEVEDWVISQP